MLTKILSFISVVGIVSSLFLFSLYQGTHSELKLLGEKYTKLEGQLNSCIESKVKLEESRKVTDQIVFTDQVKQKDLDVVEDRHIQELNNIPVKCPKVGTGDKHVPKDNVAGIHDKLPSELTSLLNKVYNERSSSTSP